MKSSSLVTPLGFKPKTFRTFSDLIRLKNNTLSGHQVTPLGFKPKTFRTFSDLIRLKKQYSCRQLSDSVGIQTQDLQNRNLTLYSAKLRSLTMVQR